MFARRYWPARFFAPRYFPQSQGDAPVVSGDVEELLYSTLGALVANRAYPNVFPQKARLPAWPAIRYRIEDVVAAPDLCGDGDADDTRVSIELAAESYPAGLALRAQVMTAMRSFSIPAVWQGERRRYDPDAKTHNFALDYLIYTSSGTGAYPAPALGDAADYVTTIEDDLVTALQALFAGRMYPNAFPQKPRTPVWPSLRYQLISAVPAVDLCGDGGDGTADVRFQFDIVAVTYAETRTLRSQLLTALQAFDPPALRDGERGDYDGDTKTHKRSLDYQFYPSSPDDSP